MPKKHQPAYASIKPKVEQTSRPTSSANPPPPRSVNDRIQQLRREQTPRATTQRRDEITEVVTHRTVPPHLRRLLHMVEVDAPAPKPGTRTRTTLRPGQRPPPGPAAPSSWLNSSRHAPVHLKSFQRKFGAEEHGPSRFCRLVRVHDDEFKRLPSSRSLAHHCLRTFALHWEDLAEYEQHYLPTLPIALKEAMLSYLSLYGYKGCLDLRKFKILFQGDQEVDGASGSDGVRFLDLTGLLNREYSLKDLEKSLQRSDRSAAVTSSLTSLSLDPSTQKAEPAIDIAESWEDEAEDSPTPNLLTMLNIPTFPNLTRLSLAHPGSSASWTDLLALSPHLKTLTHLSLAYWPRPSTTPNAATTSMVSQHATVSLGGSNLYSDLDDDWEEAANILRRLSLNTYCLKWLDLEGCTWLPALTLDPAQMLQSERSRGSRADTWVSLSTIPGPDWNAAWRQITYLNVFQGWIPADRKSLQNMPAGVIPVRLMKWLRDRESEEVNAGGEGASSSEGRHDWKELLNYESGHAVAAWVEREKVARSVGQSIAMKRKMGEGVWCEVDYGWG